MTTYPAMMAHPPVHHVVYTVPHVNQAWTALHEVPYERFHEGGPAVLVSNGTTASYVPPHHIIKTQAFQQALPVYASCPHFVQLGTCMLGASCGLVHPVQLRAPVLPAYSAVLPTMGGAALTPTSIMYITPTSSVVVPQGTPQPQAATAPQQGLPAWPSARVPAAMRPPSVLSTLFQPADAPLDTTRVLRFSNCRQRRGNKPLVIPPPAAGDTELGPRQLIVNYLAPRVDTDGLRQLFEAFGEVEDALVVTDLRTGASRGFGFVVFKRSTVAASVIHAASGRVLLGKRIRIGYINPQFPVNEGLSLSDIARTLEPLLCSDEAMTDDTSNDASHEHSMSGTVMDDDTPTPGATPLEAVSMEGDFLCTSAHFQESL